MPNISTLAHWTKDVVGATGGSTTDGTRFELLFAVDSIVRVTTLTCPGVSWTQVFTSYADCYVFHADSIPTHSARAPVISTGSLSAGYALSKVMHDIA